MISFVSYANASIVASYNSTSEFSPIVNPYTPPKRTSCQLELRLFISRTFQQRIRQRTAIPVE